MPICPYPDCNGELQSVGVCSQCGRSTKMCAACGAQVRIFASFCRVCGTPVPSTDIDWVTFKGSPGRLGTYHYQPGWSLDQLDRVSPLQKIGGFPINGPCTSLLTYDGHLFALSATGSLAVAPLMHAGDLQTHVWFVNLGTQTRVDAVPAIHKGSFYVAAGSQLFAYTLSDLSAPNMVERWRHDFDLRVPFSALLPVEDSLYVTLAHDSQCQRGSMVRLDGVSGTADPGEVLLYNGWMPSPAAATSDGNEVFFLAADIKDIRDLYCGVVAHRGEDLVHVWRRVVNPPSPMDPFHPIAVRNGKIFAVFRQRQALYRIDTKSAQIDEMIVHDVRKFSFSANGHPLVVTPGNVVMPTRNFKEELLTGLTVHSQPLLLGNVAAVVGMGEGEVWIFDVGNRTCCNVWRVPGASAGITALAPYGDILAIGDANGAITIARFNVNKFC